MEQELRWLAVVTYNTANGPLAVDHAFEEIEELQEIIERGPDWHCLVDVVVTLNPRRACYVVTYEESLLL